MILKAKILAIRNSYIPLKLRYIETGVQGNLPDIAITL